MTDNTFPNVFGVYSNYYQLAVPIASWQAFTANTPYQPDRSGLRVTATNSTSAAIQVSMDFGIAQPWYGNYAEAPITALVPANGFVQLYSEKNDGDFQIPKMPIWFQASATGVAVSAVEYVS